MGIVKLLFALIVSGIFAASSVVQAGTARAGIVEVNGTKLYYEMRGEGQPLVFIHGGGFDRRMWDDQFEPFSKQFKVIRYDVRGYGKSAMPTRPYSDVDDLHQLLNTLRVKKTHLVGLCMGSRIAVEF